MKKLFAISPAFILLFPGLFHEGSFISTSIGLTKKTFKKETTNLNKTPAEVNDLTAFIKLSEKIISWEEPGTTEYLKTSLKLRAMHKAAGKDSAMFFHLYSDSVKNRYSFYYEKPNASTKHILSLITKDQQNMEYVSRNTLDSLLIGKFKAIKMASGTERLYQLSWKNIPLHYKAYFYAGYGINTTKMAAALFPEDYPVENIAPFLKGILKI